MNDWHCSAGHLLLVALCLAVAGAAAPVLPAAATWCVSPVGRDTWSGRLAAPDAAGTDGPFATVVRARDEVRRAVAAKPTGPLTVYLRGGTYRQTQTLEFTPADSGTAAAPVSWAAYPGERPVITGGRPISGWHAGPGKLWQTTVPGVKEGQWYFHQLFVNGQRRTRARTPNVGYLYTLGTLAPFNHAKWWDPNIEAKQGFRYRDDDLKRWHNLDDALVVIYHSWTTSIHHITALDSAEKTVKLAPRSAWPIGYWWEYNTRYQVENIFEALDEPGEWYLDRQTGVLSYWPLPGENLARADVEAPVVRQTLLAFNGRPEQGQPIEWLTFRGVSFQHTDAYIAADMPLDQQGGTEQKALLAAVGLRHSRFEDCELAHAGENGVWFDRGCSDNLIRRCEIHDLGASGLFIMPRPYSSKPELLVERNVVDNCFVHDGSRIFRGSSGVLVGQASGNELTHNEICDFAHIGISVGYSWGYAPSTANHNLVAFNHVHHICNGIFSDGGGIYTLGLSPGTVIRNNVVHDVVPTPLMPVGGCGIYHDEGSTGILVENNVVYDTGAAAYTQHYGQDNLARNNIFAFAGTDPICCARAEDHRSYTFEGNIVLSDGGQATSDHYSPMKCKTEFQHNLYWDTSGHEPKFSGVTFAAWQATGRDQDSKIADPRFVDARRRDFRLQPDSPALAMGFKPIDTREVGLYGDRPWVEAPRKIRRAPLPELPEPPPPPPPAPVREDFERDVTGQLPQTVTCSPSDRTDAIQVSEEFAAGGRKSLKLSEVDKLQYVWQPHILVSCRPHTSGLVRFTSDLLNHPQHPTECTVALRDYSHKGFEFREGPSLTLHADGQLTALGKSLGKFPAGKWLHLDFLVDLGQPGQTPPKTYRLTVTVAGEAPQVFTAVPYLHQEFTQVSWAGWSLGGPVGTSCYVDNIRLEGGQ